MIFGFAILATAVLLSCVAAYYSVAGLTAIFSAATIPVIIMGGSLELGKIVATVWLHNNWRRAPFLFKAYLVPAVAFLMLLTSMGIFGYLSKAHSDQSLVSGDAVAKVAIYDEKIKIAKDNIDANRKALKQMDEAVDQVMGRSQDEKGADKAVAIRRGQTKERTRLLSEISAEQKVIAQLNEERAPLAAEFRKVESEVGPIKYIAALVYGDNPDQNILEKAVRLVIIMIVLVFDPLALTLILAANKQFEWAMHGRGGWVHDDDDRVVKAPEQPKEDVPPDPQEQTVPLKEDPHTVGWMFDKFPYLKNGAAMFFQDTKPIVAAPASGTPVFVDPPPKWSDEDILHVYDDERLVSNADKKILAAGVDVIDRPGDYVTVPSDEDSEENDPKLKAAIKQWKRENPEKTIKHQRQLYEAGIIDRLPWMDLIADNLPARKPVSTFGLEFPTDAIRGDTFVKIDKFPHIVYKFNGTSWMVIDKTVADSYTYDLAYIDYLIEKINSGEYDVDLLSDTERDQITQRLKVG